MQVWTVTYMDPGYYGTPDPKDIVHHESQKAAKEAFWHEAQDDRLGDPMNMQAYVFFYEPPDGDSTDCYPDRIMKFGPRGGIHMEYC